VSDDISIPPPGYYAHHRRQGSVMDSGTIRLAVIAGGILLGVGLAYAGLSLFHHRTGEVPVIQADDRPIRVKPENPGGMQIAGAGSEMFSGGSDTNGSKLAPAPETPNPQALRTEVPAAPPQPAPAPTALVAAAARAIAPTPVAPTPVAPTPVAPTLAAVKPAVQPAAHGKAGIQLAAVGSEADARAEWQRLQKRYPAVLAGHQLAIGKTELNGKTFWRVRTGGFPDLAQAKSACEKVKTKGGACSAAEF
jgi:hypothetical protein